MDSRIPKPSGTKKIFDFGAVKENSSNQETRETKKPLTEINKAFSTFKFTSNAGRARSPSFRTQPVAQSKLRRSRSAMDLGSNQMKAGVKRFQPTLDPIPNKRMKPTGTVQPPLPIRTQEKKTLISNSLKSTSNIVTVAQKKIPLTKSSSGPSTSKGPAAASKTTAAAPPKAAAKSTKPPSYDFKARFALANERNLTLKTQNEELKEKLTVLEEKNEDAEQKQLDLTAKIETVEQEVLELTQENEKLRSEIVDLQKANDNFQTKNHALAASLAATSDELSELKVKQEKLEETARNHEVLKVKAEKLEDSLKDANEKLLQSQDQLYLINVERMALHNMVLDLRGNIRVFARVRPPIVSEGGKAVCAWSFIDETSLEIGSNELVPSGGRKPTKHDFAFDHVFDPNSGQEEIYDMVAPLIQSALDGYNVCIFAYGQTGSGKTFTMDGAEGQLGIIPRTVQLLFNSLKSASILGWSYTITASFLEIYNEVLFDLLNVDEKDIEIRMANAKSKTEIYVSNLTQEEVTDEAQLYNLMRIARSNRATAATTGNERSSRSHAVTRLEIVGKHSTRPEVLVGYINLVDLAGSESPKTSTRMEETKNINRSLSELSNVILALVQKNEHVPYRNSKLTHLLMPSLGGNSKTLMFVNVSPFQENFNESVKSLRFAAQVNSCKMAKAKRNKQMNLSSIV